MFDRRKWCPKKGSRTSVVAARDWYQKIEGDHKKRIDRYQIEAQDMEDSSRDNSQQQELERNQEISVEGRI